MLLSPVRLFLTIALVVAYGSVISSPALQAKSIRPNKSADSRQTLFHNHPASAAQDSATPAFSSNFDVQKIAEGVYALIRKDPLGLWFAANNVVIVNDEDVIVVDANITAAATREVLALIRRLTNKPIKFVINTHWHEDHIIGNWVYREAFPAVEFIGHRSTLEDLPTVGAANRKQSVDGGSGLVKLLRDSVAQQKSLAGGKLTGEESAGYNFTANLIEQYLSESTRFQILLPTIVVDERLTLHRGSRVIDIRHLGKAHTAADLVVHLPKEGILITGDLVVHPVPLVGSTSYPAAYSTTLETLLGLRANIIVPGHGPVMRDDTYVKLMVRLLTAIKKQVEAAVARGETLDQARKSVNLEEYRQAFAGESQLKSFLFLHYVSLPAVAAAYRQATTKS